MLPLMGPMKAKSEAHERVGRLPASAFTNCQKLSAAEARMPPQIPSFDISKSDGRKLGYVEDVVVLGGGDRPHI